MEEVILVTGSNGQLGCCIKSVVGEDKKYIFTSREDLDITDYSNIDEFLNNHSNIRIIINCAAYTDVRGAETEEGYIKAKSINVIGVNNLAIACRERDIFLIHIGTDYIYGGEIYNDIRTPINENMFFNKFDMSDGLNKYALTKLLGISDMFRIMKKNFLVIVTSWLYSEYGKNFVKTIYNNIKMGKQCKVINTQVGSPTYAKDLAMFIVDVVKDTDKFCNIRLINFSNLGVASWYDLAKAIDIENNSNLVVPTTKEYDDVVRPSYSVLDTELLMETERNKSYIRHWLEALKDCFSHLS